MKNKTLSVGVFMAVALIPGTTWGDIEPSREGGSEIAKEQAPVMQTKGYVVRVHSDSCGICQILAPRYEAIKSAYANKEVTFITFDLSTPESTARSALLAKETGLEELFQKNQKTATLMVVDNNNRREVKRLTIKNTDAEIKSVIDQLLSSREENAS